MRLILALAFLCAIFGMTDALAASSSDAREVARLNNCTPKKIEVYQQTLGAGGRTIYRVECNLPKGKDEQAIQTADAMLIQCDGNLCGLLRPVGTTSK